MSLLVWLPLNGDLHNQGLSDITVTNSGATVNDNGKIGKCYSFDGNGHYLQLSQSLGNIYAGDFTWALWLKPTDDTRSVLISDYNSGPGSSRVTFELYTNRQVRVYWDGVVDWRPAYYVPKDIWTHIAVNRKGDLLTLYVNGEYYASNNGSLTNKDASNPLRIGDDYRGGTTVSYAGFMNDIRIYNHCLSPKEVKEISRGLVRHYKLEQNNLIKNGWGGLDNWQKSNVTAVSTDVPISPSGMTNSYTNNNETKEYIPLDINHSYTCSGWVKKNSASSPTCYLTLIPYDIDKNQIPYHMTPEGFVARTLTTLSQDLRSGDTVVHLTDASSWANPSKYQVNVAIFGYQDSTGYVYPDLVYTRRVYAYGTTTDKSHLDVSGNKVTLNSPYSGETISAGTGVCLDANGSTFFYPASIPSSSAENWTFLTKTFIPNEIKRFNEAVKYVRFTSLASYQWNAGCTLIDDTDSFVLKDASGYNNDLTKVGDLQYRFETPRYVGCSYMNNTSTMNHLEAEPIGVSDNIFSVSFWVKTIKTDSQVFLADPKMTIGILATADAITVCPTSHKMFTKSNFVMGKWNHIVGIRNGDNYSLYINGVAESETVDSNYFTHDVQKLWLLHRSSNSTGGASDAEMSDVRIYATALSADDVAELYNTAAVTDKQGNLLSYEFIEKDSQVPQIAKTGIVKTDEFVELRRLDYITANGNQYINTGVILTSPYNIENYVDVQFANPTSDDFETVVGFVKSSTTPRYGIHKYQKRWMIGINYTSGNVAVNANRHKALFVTGSEDRQSLYIDGVSVISEVVMSNIYYEQNDMPLYLFARNNNNSAIVNYFSGNIGRTWLKQNGEYLYDCIPCLDKNNVAGMYDRISKQFFPSEGSQPFIAGPLLSISAIYEDRVEVNELIEI